MTKRQWFLVASTAVLAACSNGLAPCVVSESNEDTGETYCPRTQISQPAESPTASIGEPDSN